MIGNGGPKSLVQWHWILRPETPWSVRGPGQEGASVSGPALDWRGRPYVPGSTMRGKIRDSFSRLAHAFQNTSGEPDTILSGHRKDWRDMERYCFGAPGIQPGRLYVDDSYMPDDVDASNLQFASHHRTAIHRRLGVVKDGFLVSEALVGTEWSFVGGMSLYSTREDVVALLTLAILGIEHLGSGRSIGRGRLSWNLSNDDGPGTSRLTVTMDGDPWTPATSLSDLREWTFQTWFQR
ncbi:hypothetical protein CVV65_13440 [Kyrpidia spormannii]|uniref:CRISPR type III-associated protein domain-containing protein n=1 Tax=Kyrpidia spormannii TaxID=2055160 RepID=A0A2K8N904_9BACL|nr:RAMP superfamily CRISPR-associated protein [Kyrpidia spormannii]ATY85804.1 hypothetical protein CVV65_13440 [Kyrpidia spormannii]